METIQALKGYFNLCLNFGPRGKMITRQCFRLNTSARSANITFRAWHACSASSQRNYSTIKVDGNIIKSSIDSNIPDNKSLYDFMTANFDKFPDKTAVIDGISGKQISYGELDTSSKKFGSVLSKCGLGIDEKIALFAPNCVEYASVILGTSGIGGCISTMNPQYTRREVVKQIEDSHSKVLVTVKPLLETALEAAQETGIKQVILLGEEESKQHGIINWCDVNNDAGDAFKNNSYQINVKENCAFLPYSSGTTGVPKGVMLTHHNVISNLVQFGKGFELIPREIVLGILPFFHIYGLVTIALSSLEHGKTVVTLPKFEPESFLKAIQESKVDYASLVPPLLLFLIKSPEVKNFDISSLKVITTGAAPFGGDLWKSFEDRFEKQIKIIQGYGLTETSPVATLTPGDNTKIATVGKPVPNSEVKIIDPVSGESLGPYERGEVVIRGPHIMKGYLNNEKATSACLSKDGWFYSGDIGYYDDDHDFFIVDRLKELIKYKGFQVPPAELEDILMSHPKVADAAVIGIPNDEAGELPKAFVVVKEDDVSADELISYVEKTVAPHKKLRGGLQFIDVIPKAASGKILRRELRSKYAN